MKISLVTIGAVLAAVGLADLLLGNTDHPILPAALGNGLSQQTDIAALAVGGGMLWYGLTQA